MIHTMNFKMSITLKLFGEKTYTIPKSQLRMKQMQNPYSLWNKCHFTMSLKNFNESYLNFHSQHPFTQPFQTRRLSSEAVPEVFVDWRVPDQLARMIEEQDLHVVLEGVANQDSVLQQIAHLLLHYLEILTWKNNQMRKMKICLNRKIYYY